MIRRDKIEYSEKMRRPEKAASYDRKYERELHKVISDRREKRLLRSLLEPVDRQERLLDVPCGAGRLSGVFAEGAERVYEVDYSREMLKLCRKNARSYEPRLASASAFQLPFPDRTFDVVVSIRLSHHIPDLEGRLHHLRELFRTSRRYVLATFFCEESLKNRLRNVYRRLGGKKRAKYTLSRGHVRELARECHFRIVKEKYLSRLFSGHLFVLFQEVEKP